jgi:hypothetical protein
MVLPLSAPRARWRRECIRGRDVTYRHGILLLLDGALQVLLGFVHGLFEVLVLLVFLLALLYISLILTWYRLDGAALQDTCRQSFGWQGEAQRGYGYSPFVKCFSSFLRGSEVPNKPIVIDCKCCGDGV